MQENDFTLLKNNQTIEQYLNFPHILIDFVCLLIQSSVESTYVRENYPNTNFSHFRMYRRACQSAVNVADPKPADWGESQIGRP